ncbi:hypothetical protein HY045_01610 [Candidatus Woesebacteria bacterium]|nr:hypothetical protein [Candidatus Woesebacteria bacterium]
MKSFSWVVVLVLALVFLVGVVIYKNAGLPSQYLPNLSNSGSTSLTTPPQQLGKEISLTINTPQDGATINSSSVVVGGTTVPGADVFINDQETKADPSGKFSMQISLDQGENVISVAVNDASGNYSEKELTVTSEQ